MNSEVFSSGKTAVDVGAGIVTIGTIGNWLPLFVSVLAAIWYLIRIGEWLHSKFSKKKTDAVD